jgi:hypothetical protein
MIGGSSPSRGWKFSLTTASIPALGPYQPPIQWVPGTLSLGVRRPGRKADHSPPSSAEVKECVELYLHYPNTPSCLYISLISLIIQNAEPWAKRHWQSSHLRSSHSRIVPQATNETRIGYVPGIVSYKISRRASYSTRAAVMVPSYEGQPVVRWNCHS